MEISNQRVVKTISLTHPPHPPPSDISLIFGPKKTLHPLKTKNEKFADFCENSMACSSLYAELRTFRIF